MAATSSPKRSHSIYVEGECGTNRVFGIDDDGPCSTPQPMPGDRRLYATSRPIEQRNRQRVLERTNSTAHYGRRRSEYLGGAPNASKLVDLKRDMQRYEINRGGFKPASRSHGASSPTSQSVIRSERGSAPRPPRTGRLDLAGRYRRRPALGRKSVRESPRSASSLANSRPADSRTCAPDRD
jgi:hypothetical protein